MDTERLQQQIAFIIEIDKLKGVLRRTYVPSAGRLENSAEHSWQLAMMCLVLAEHANESFDMLRAMKLVLVHDIVEIDAGDTYCYDMEAMVDKAEREEKAAGRVFGLLPEDQAGELRALWEEFEARQTPEARFGAAIDRLMPIMLNAQTDGKSWLEHGIGKDQALSRNAHIAEGSQALWDVASSIIEEAAEKGYLKKD